MCASPALADGTTLYVDGTNGNDQDGSENCQTQSSPCATIGPTVSQAASYGARCFALPGGDRGNTRMTYEVSTLVDRVHPACRQFRAQRRSLGCSLKVGYCDAGAAESGRPLPDVLGVR
jgi:hypothetical protein